MIAFPCPFCHKKLSVKDDLAGKKVKCPGCGTVLTVPAAGGEASWIVTLQRILIKEDWLVHPGAQFTGTLDLKEAIQVPVDRTDFRQFGQGKN